MFRFPISVLLFSVFMMGSFFSSEAHLPGFSPFSKESDATQPLASLTFCMQSKQEQLDREEGIACCEEEKVIFSDEEIHPLFDKVSHRFSLFSGSKIHKEKKKLIKKARDLYDQAKKLIDEKKSHSALQPLEESHQILLQLWEEACEEEFFFDLEDSLGNRLFLAKKLEDPHLEKNPYIPPKVKRQLRPYLLPLHHPMRPKLDAIFCESRATQNRHTFHEAGFRLIARGPRSFINVAKHPLLPHHLVKVYFDNETQRKEKRSSWHWLIYRCQGADKIRKIIKKYEVKHFTVAKKWIYCFPAAPSPPTDIFHTRHFALLLVTDMQLVSRNYNSYAWSHKITQEHLHELYTILSRAKGSSYRPDNIAYTKKGQFAFIDTEYPTRGPDFKRIRPYLNKEMQAYWDQLIKRGGD